MFSAPPLWVTSQPPRPPRPPPPAPPRPPSFKVAPRDLTSVTAVALAALWSESTDSAVTAMWQQCSHQCAWQHCTHHCESSGNWQRCRSTVSCHCCHSNVEIVISAPGSHHCHYHRCHNAVLVFVATTLCSFSPSQRCARFRCHSTVHIGV